MNETSITTKFKTRWQSLYPQDYVLKISDRYHVGVPDLLIIHCGQTVFIEFKYGHNLPSKMQTHEMRKIWMADGYGAFITYIDGTYYLVDNVDGPMEYDNMEELINDVEERLCSTKYFLA